jgi:D-psicose/D-tagatose/L-ribulose 3-epimerase
MKLSASNIAWPAASKIDIYKLLSNAGFTGIEVAPTKFAPWEDLTPAVVAEERKILADNGLVASSYQAILFGRPNAQLLGSSESFVEMKDHLKLVASFASNLSNGGPAVFGAPKNRLRNGLDEDEAFALGRDRFRELAEDYSDLGMVLVLEPAPEFYGGDFLTTTEACSKMVAAVDHPNFKLHIDTGCAIIEKSDVSASAREYGDMVSHFHLSRPNLVPFTDEDLNLAGAADALSAHNYAGWYALEMRETDSFARDIQEAAGKIKSAFSGRP